MNFYNANAYSLIMTFSLIIAIAPTTIAKAVLAGITVIIGFVASILEIRKNPKYWLNRFFGLFFIVGSIGFLLYIVYHMIFTEIKIVLTLMIISNILLNFCLACLLMTSFILQYSEKVAISSKYLLITFGLFVLSIIGYIFWTPSVNAEEYAKGNVDTNTPILWLILVTLYRLGIMIYVLVKFTILLKFAESLRVKKQLNRFVIGMVINTIGIVLFLFGNQFGNFGAYLEIIGQICFNVAIVTLLMGFFIKEEK